MERRIYCTGMANLIPKSRDISSNVPGEGQLVVVMSVRSVHRADSHSGNCTYCASNFIATKGDDNAVTVY